MISDILEIGGFNVVGIGHNGKEAVPHTKNTNQILFS